MKSAHENSRLQRKYEVGAERPLRITRAFLAGMDEAAPQETQIVHVADRRIGF